MKSSRTLAFACMLAMWLNAVSSTIASGETLDRMPTEAALSNSPTSADDSVGRARYPQRKLIAVIADGQVRFLLDKRVWGAVTFAFTTGAVRSA
jgi:hypothetical protein